ncbi:MAG: dolichol-phosphate mannosyltransferase [Bradymonadia bacterium]|jgi:dolichol-phosphate mannosyltransferase
MTKEQRRFVKFALVGGTGVFVNIAVAFLCSQVAFASWANRNSADLTATLVAILVSIFTNFLINDSWTWSDREKVSGKRSWLMRCGFYYATNGVAGALQYGVSFIIISMVAAEGVYFGISALDARAAFAALVGIAVATPLNYVINNKVTFREKKPSESAAAQSEERS